MADRPRTHMHYHIGYVSDLNYTLKWSKQNVDSATGGNYITHIHNKKVQRMDPGPR